MHVVRRIKFIGFGRVVPTSGRQANVGAFEPSCGGEYSRVCVQLRHGQETEYK